MRALVVVPTYNEAATIERVLETARQVQVDVLVVDDGSPDGTADIVAEAALHTHGIHLLRRDGKSGLGSAYRAGFTWALRSGRYDAICQMDADLSHDPRDLKRLVDALVDGADVAIGSRYVPGGSTRNWPVSRQLLSKGGNTYVRLVTGMRLGDATAGFRAWRSPVVEELHLVETRSDGYSFQLETAVRAWAAGKRFAEVPIEFTERAEGVSKMSSAIVGEAMVRVLGWGWQLRTGWPLRPATPAAAMAVSPPASSDTLAGAAVKLAR